MTAWRIIWSSDRKLAWGGYELTITEFRSDALTYCLSGHEFNSNSDPFLYSYSNYIVCLVFDFISSIAFISRHFYFTLKFSWGNHMSVAEWSDTYGIHQWRIIWSSYRKLAWGGFEPTTTEFRSNPLAYLSYQAMSSSHTQSQLSTTTPSSLFAQCPISFRLLPSLVAMFVLIEISMR